MGRSNPGRAVFFVSPLFVRRGRPLSARPPFPLSRRLPLASEAAGGGGGSAPEIRPKFGFATKNASGAVRRGVNRSARFFRIRKATAHRIPNRQGPINATETAARPKFGQNSDFPRKMRRARCSAPTQRLAKRLGTLAPHIMADHSGESGGRADRNAANEKIFEFPKFGQNLGNSKRPLLGNDSTAGQTAWHDCSTHHDGLFRRVWRVRGAKYGPRKNIRIS